MASDAWARVDAVLRDNLPLLAEEWPEDIPVLVDAVLLAAGPSEDEARLARERDEARAEAARYREALEKLDACRQSRQLLLLAGPIITEALAGVRALRGAGEKDDG